MIRKPVKVVLVAGRSGLVCNTCGHWKPLGFMARDCSKPSGRRGRCRACERRRSWGYRRVSPERTKASARRYRYASQYGITESDVESMLLEQSGCCYLCSEPLMEVFHVDHCHSTLVVRGLAHRRCNLGIGQAGDDPQMLRRWADALEAAA